MKKTGIAAVFAAAALGISVCAFPVIAADYEADVSSAVKSNSWGQSFKLYSTDFDPARLTEDSEFVVEYSIVGDVPELTTSPVELIAQCWMVTDAETGEDSSDGEIWAKVAPYEYNETKASFKYNDILKSYISVAEKNGLESAGDITDLSGVLCFNVGDTGQCTILCKKLTVTNVSEASDTKSEALTGINAYIPVESPGEYKGTEEIFKVTKFDFDATRLNKDSKMIIHYDTMSSTPAFSPVNVVLISTENTTVPENIRDEEGNVSEKLALPEFYDDTQTVFNCAQILNAYGTGDFSQLYDFSVVGTNQPITVTGVEFTNVNPFGTRSEILSEREAQAAAAEEKDPVPMAYIIGFIAGFVALILIALFVYTKVSGKRTYDLSSGSYVKGAPKDKQNGDNK